LLFRHKKTTVIENNTHTGRVRTWSKTFIDFFKAQCDIKKCKKPSVLCSTIVYTLESHYTLISFSIT